MAIKGLGEYPRLLLFLRLNLFEEGGKRLRIVPTLVHVLHAQVVRFRLETAAELEERDRQSQSGRLLRGEATQTWGHDDQWNRGQVSQRAARLLPRDMTGRQMGDLVCHHARYF